MRKDLYKHPDKGPELFILNLEEIKIKVKEKITKLRTQEKEQKKAMNNILGGLVKQYNDNSRLESLGEIPDPDSNHKDSDENLINSESKEAIIQIGAIDEFVLNQGYPFKKQSVYGKIIIQQGRLDEFVLNQGYPFKRKSDSIGSNFKIIVNF